MADDKDIIAKLEEENEMLANEVIETKLQGLKGQLVSLGDTVHQRMNDTDKKNDIEFAHIKEGIDQVLVVAKETFTQAKETNGRVTELEKKRILEQKEKEIQEEKLQEVSKNTRVVRFLHKYPLVSSGFLLVGYLFTLQEIRQFTFDSVSKFFGLFSKIF